MNIIIVIFLWHIVNASEMDYIPDSWVDPTDMRHYDRANKKMNYPSSNVKSLTTNITPVDVNTSTVCSKDVERFEIFFERLINHLLCAANLKNKVMEPKTRITTEIPVHITSEELSQLLKLSQKMTSSKLNELDSLFSSVFTDDRGFSFDSLTPYLNPLQLLFFNLSYEKVTILIFIIIFGVVMWMFAIGRELKKILTFLYLIFFMGGLGWNWWKMYQEAIIEQYAEAQRLSQIPDICIPKKVGFFGFLFSSSNTEDCRKYHSSFQFNPFAKVPPSVVLSETVSGMMIYPLKALGSSVGEFLVGINSAASWPLNIIFLPFIFIISTAALLCIIIVCLGVKLNFWTLLGGVSIGGKIQNESPKHLEIVDEFSLKKTIECYNENTFVVTRVGIIRKCITAVNDEIFIEKPAVEMNPPNFNIIQRFHPQKSSKTAENSNKAVNLTRNNQNVGHNVDYDADYLRSHWGDILKMLNCNTKKQNCSFRSISQKSAIYKKKIK